MKKTGYVYLLCNKNRSVLYLGVTSNLPKRIDQHKTKYYPNSFTAKYNCDQLVYYRIFETITEAIQEEKRLKGGSRKQKVDLINESNPEWVDLWNEIQ
ncbi:MAG: GIY-YIG nuclease family protein [Chitinophagaceae bacterium]